ncbi:TPA: hypothetical protein PXM11_003747 [Yersinia enterocolitica]|uniref:phage baseplate plug family protein n=1 Tax=Yersinia TaxID=629 RepID=UPI0011A279F6|nr:hypothetical protein [Yersinia mollaretii]HDL6968276.1 hypothetical protein [Yersinia enterocolitica]HDL6972384.1 hypothetical protein [Yersinia enterocolitica]HDL6976097.1 hypothetical protein [Yersinia enterocolitica]HDL6988995.1 hypothetical protein [Yersinia enterocolitica]HDL6997656.1 hypothetical protein [Yersinia enterocolitica]
MLTVATAAVPSQIFNVNLGGQNTRIKLFQKNSDMFINVSVNSTEIAMGVLCRNKVRLIREPYLKFIGDLFFIDTAGESDPDYTGLGSRFVLMYLEEGDL